LPGCRQKQYNLLECFLDGLTFLKNIGSLIYTRKLLYPLLLIVKQLVVFRWNMILFIHVAETGEDQELKLVKFPVHYDGADLQSVPK
jgi:hypothetical protein